MKHLELWGGGQKLKVFYTEIFMQEYLKYINIKEWHTQRIIYISYEK